MHTHVNTHTHTQGGVAAERGSTSGGWRDSGESGGSSVCHLAGQLLGGAGIFTRCAGCKNFFGAHHRGTPLPI